MPDMTGGDAVYYALRAMGVDHVFGIPSVHNIPIYDAILRNGGITPISARHEQGAAHMADAYARATGKLGVCVTSTGPGAVNAVTGLYEAGFASSPVLMITGQIESRYYGKGKGFLHEAENQLPMLRTITRRAESVRRTEDIVSTLINVAKDICTGRPQPGAVEIPIDFQYAVANVDVPSAVSWPKVEPERKALAEAISVLNNAKRPILWAGGGVIIADAAAELTRLAETLNAPVLTSISGRGAIPENHPLCIGPLSDRQQVQDVLKEADVLLAVGTRFQARLTLNWTLPLPAKFIHLDADPGVIGRNYAPSVGIVGDAKLGLAGLLRGVKGGQTDPAFVTKAQEARDQVHRAIRDQIGPDFSAVLDIIHESFPADGFIVRDATIAATLWANRILPIITPRTSINPTGTAIGPALPLGIGAAVGSGKKTLVITGDGGFMLNLSELATAVECNAPVIICVFNDKGYGVLRHIQARTFEGRQIGVDLHTPDFVTIAQAMGMSSERVASPAQFQDALKRAVAASGPVLIDLDLTAFQPMKWFVS